MSAGIAYADDDANGFVVAEPASVTPASQDEGKQGTQEQRALVQKILARVAKDRKHHRKAFKRMRMSQEIALRGATRDWPRTNYTANLIGRHIAQKSAVLYAKNPKVVSRRRERMDFAVWDEGFESLALAFQTVQQGSAALQMAAMGPPAPGTIPGLYGAPANGTPVPGADPVAQAALAAIPAPPAPLDPAAMPIGPVGDPSGATFGDPALGDVMTDPMTGGPAMDPRLAMGANGGPPLEEPPQPELPPGLETAAATLEDFQTGIHARDLAEKHGRTLEILLSYFLQAGAPLDVKGGLKQVVRRAATCCVGYVSLDYQRTTSQLPSVTSALADSQAQLKRLQSMQDDAAKDDADDRAEIAEIQAKVASLQAEPAVTREGLVFDFPGSTSVIPDRITREITGFVGARWITIERLMTPEMVKDQFGVDIGKNFKPFRSSDGMSEQDWNNDNVPDGAAGDMPDILEDPAKGSEDMVSVLQHWDKTTGLVSVVADGFQDFLREPGPPPVVTPQFWNTYALTFNPIEHEKELFPPSDVELMIDQQMEYNRSREGLRLHRRAAMPRWVYPNGILEEEDIQALRSAAPFQAIGINIEPNVGIDKVLMQVPMKGVDPNLYETNQILTDLQLVVGTSESQLGGTGGGTATEASIAAGAQQTAQGSNIDDMDAFLSRIARDAGGILQREMSEESVKRIVGPGAVWPDMSPEDIAEEVFLEVLAGSSGKPNQAAEVNNWKLMLPYLVQMPHIDSVELARETLRRLDDKLDLTKLVAQGALSVMAQNKAAMTVPGDAGQPDMQGAEGGANAPQAPGQESPGSAPTMGQAVG